MIIVDAFEPQEAQLLLSQSIKDVMVDTLNLKGYADYFFWGVDGHSIQNERKTAEEVLSGLDNVEEQLRREYNKADELILTIENIIVPAPDGCYVYHQARDEKFFFRYRTYKVSYAMYRAWIYQLDKSGITVYDNIPSFDATMAVISALYHNSQKGEHTTLQRYIVPKIYLEDYDPHILALLGLSHAYKLGIGEEKAKALVGYFGSLGVILGMDEKTLAEVPGIGTKIAKRLKESLAE